ncbi:carbohydrate ABC transporter substrate-binding protein [Metabacillus sp. KIGAM252]|uniref:Carbohydrate ABC transporter substrate-binding protein n=1 Tax=Metabacillus flavus TaxID=2823519 RepID=A0ABS5LJR5_9BACI|nr:ABC transporter substrate-binding protein [Metabacillus flavus]MBS2970609.1 carbohydrate ABC transporter substrate-binding protein [Metabacillus flavus]
MLNKKTLLLSSALILGLAGCSTGGGDKTSSSSNKGDVTLNIFQGKVEFKTQFEDLAKKYEEEHPDVSIKVQTVGGGNDYAGTLKTKLASGEEPTIFTVSGQTDIDQYRDRLSDLKDTKAADLAVEGALDNVKQGDEIVGLPVNLEGYGIIYNKKIFKDAGIDPASIKSMEDLKKAAETLDSQKDKLKLDAVFALAAKEKWVQGNHAANVFVGDDFKYDPKATYEAKDVPLKNSAAFKEYIDLQNKYSAQPVINLDYSQQVEELFSTGRVAMIQQGNWVYPTVEQMDPELAEKGIGIIPIPLNGEAKMPVGVPSYYVVNKKADEKQQKAARDFLDWMYTSDTGKEAVLSEFKFIPAYEEYDSSKIADPLSKEIYKYTQDGNTTTWVFQNFPLDWSDMFGAEVQKYLAGKSSWDDLVKEMQSKWSNARK